MNPFEEELQKKIEAGENISSPSADEKAYRMIFNSLSKEPDYYLSPSFADRVLQRIETKDSASSFDFFWLGFGVFLLVLSMFASLAVVMAYLDFRPDLSLFSWVGDYAGLMVLAAILIVAFNWLDRRLVMRKLSTE